MNKKVAKNASESLEAETESYENGKDETDKVTVDQEEVPFPEEEASKIVPPSEETQPAAEAPPKAPFVFTPKYKYSDGKLTFLLKLIASYCVKLALTMYLYPQSNGPL